MVGSGLEVSWRRCECLRECECVCCPGLLAFIPSWPCVPGPTAPISASQRHQGCLFTWDVVQLVNVQDRPAQEPVPYAPREQELGSRSEPGSSHQREWGGWSGVHPGCAGVSPTQPGHPQCLAHLAFCRQLALGSVSCESSTSSRGDTGLLLTVRRVFSPWGTSQPSCPQDTRQLCSSLLWALLTSKVTSMKPQNGDSHGTQRPREGQVPDRD